MTNLTQQISVWYGAVSFFITVLHNIFLLYHIEMFVSVFRIDKTSFWIGETIFLLWNCINDPLFGWLGDRYILSNDRSERSGRDSNIYGLYTGVSSGPVLTIYRRIQNLMTFGPLFAFSFMLLWFDWTMPAIQFAVCLCLYDGFLTLIDLHHSALLADLAINLDQRTQLNSFQSVFSAAGATSVFLSYLVWNKTDLFDFKIFCVSVAVISAVGFVVVTHFLQKSFSLMCDKDKDAFGPHHPVKSSLESGHHTSLSTFLKQLLKHRNFGLFTAINLIQVFHCHFNSNFFPLFLEALLDEYSNIGSILLGVSFVLPHINNIFFSMLCKKYGVYSVVKGLFYTKLALAVAMFSVGIQHTLFLCIFIASNRVFTEGTCKLLSLVISDLIDEDYVRNQRNEPVSALIFGMANFLAKPGQTLAPLIGTTVLSLTTGHDIFHSGTAAGSTKLDMHSLPKATAEAYKQACFNLVVYIPIICACMQIAIWSYYKLHGKQLQTVKQMRSNVKLLMV